MLTLVGPAEVQSMDKGTAANSREGGLARKLGFGGRIEAMKLSCT